MKKVLSLVFVWLILVSCFAIPSFAADHYLMDDAALLSPDERAEVEEKLHSVSAEIGMDVLICTTNDLGGKSTEEYADDAVDYEYGSVSDGILLLFCPDAGLWHVSTLGKGIKTFSDSAIDSIFDSIRSGLKRGDYAASFERFADEVKAEYQDKAALFHVNFVSIGVPLVVALIIAWVIVHSMKGQLKSARFHNAGQYLVPGSLNLTQQTDLYLYSNVTRTRIERESSSGTHTSSSGSSHGGHGGSL